jgi:transcriptional regulator with XRE-family HTH domain
MSEEKLVTVRLTKNIIINPDGVSAIRWARENKGLTQQELAVASGVPQNTISRVESGRRNAHKGTLKKLATALEIEDWTALDVEIPHIIDLEDLSEWEPERRRRLFELYREVGFLDELRDGWEEHYRENRKRFKDDDQKDEYVASKLESAYMLGYARGFDEGRAERRE